LRPVRLADLARGRQAAWRLIGEALRPPEAERLATLRLVAEELWKRPGPLADHAVFPQWLDLLRGLLQSAGGEAGQLDETYVRLFVASSEGICPQVASHYLAPDAPASVMAALEGEYAAAGLAPSPNATEPPDHVTVTLDFMAHLCAAEADAWQRRDSAMAVAQLDREAGFLQRYLGPWLPAFARLVAARDPDGFYAQVTETAGTLAVHDLDIVSALAARAREAEGQ
jgi:TorA maturation chaperone TorD